MSRADDTLVVDGPVGEPAPSATARPGNQPADRILTRARNIAAASTGWVSQRSDPLVRYASAAAAGATLPALWYRPGHFYATGDVGPFLRDNLTAELGSIWGHQVTGAGGPSYEITRLPDILLLKLCAALGLGAPVAQALLYALILGAAAAGTSYLASCWLRNPAAAACAGALSVVNVYQLVSLLNPLPALAQALIAFLAGHLLRAAKGRRVRARTLALTTLPLCYLGMNPPLLAILALGTGAFAAASVPLTGGRLRPVLLLLLRAAPLAAGLQLWWLVPELITLRAGGSGAAFSAQTNVQAWAWTQTRNTLDNIVTLNAHWGWRFPEYYPFAPSMDRWPWAGLRWALPLLALTGAVLPPGKRRTRWSMRALAAATGALVLLCKGLHPPMAALNAWLYAYVPGMWLFREPMSKFGVLLALLLAVLAGAAVQRALDGVRASVRPRRRWALAAPAVLVAAALAYPWPLWTAAVVTKARAPLPSASVAVPAPWREVAASANASRASGKVLELPLQPYYQVLTSWGYHGADNIPQQLLHKPLFQRLPGGYFDSPPQLAELLSLTEQSLLRADTATAAGALRALDVDQVIVRHDLLSTPGDLPTADPAKLGDTLAHLPGARRTDATVLADLYELASPAPPVNSLALNRPAKAAAAAELAARGTATTDDSRAPVDGARLSFPASATQPLDLRRAGTYQVTMDRSAGISYRPEYQEDPDSPEVLLTEAQQVHVDGTGLPAAPDLHIPLTEHTGGHPAALLVGHTVLPWQPGTPVTVPAGESIAVAVPTGRDLIAGQDDGSDGSCGAGEPVTRNADGGWKVSATGFGSACVRLPLRAVPKSGLVSLSLSYRTLHGRGPRVCVWQVGPNGCAVATQLPADSSWRTWSTAVRIAPGTDSLALYGYADGAGPGNGSGAVEYREPAATALAVAGRAVAPSTAPAALSWQATAGPHQVQGSQIAPADAPAAFTGLQDCGRRDDRGFQAAGMSATRQGPSGVRLEARTHSACVAALVDSSAPDPDRGPGSYRIALRYRTLSGSPARICLWQGGPNRCATLPRLADSAAWNHFDTVFTAEPGTRDLALYLYADGDDAGTTHVEYDDIRIAPAATPLLVRIDPDSPATAVRAPQLARTGTAHYRITLSGVDSSADVVLPDSFDTRWRLTGLPAGWSARPIQADGYRAAWVVSGRGDAVLDVAFGPDRWWHRAVALSLTLLLLSAAPMPAPARRFLTAKQRAFTTRIRTTRIPTSRANAHQA